MTTTHDNLYSDIDRKAEIIKNMIRAIVATKLDRVSVTWEEVEDIYASKKYPEINAEIDYIIGGEQ